MPNKLSGQTVILTGSKVVQSAKQLIEQHGGHVEHFPLIETVEKVSADDEKWIRQLCSYDWLIFTSQNAVSNFLLKCNRYGLNVAELSQKIAAVGEKTALLLEQAHIQVHFMPTVYSADVFVQEFQLQQHERALFVRGSMAKSTIHDGTGADEWTVYETRNCLQHIDRLKHCLLATNQPVVVFASPSAVKVYAQHIVPDVQWQQVKVASIGHITTGALLTYGVKPFIQPKIYTMQAVIEQLILEEQTHD